MLYDKNMTLLKKHHFSVWQVISQYTGEPTGAIIPAADGRPNLQVENANGEKIFLHGAQNPEEEVPQFLGMIPEDATGVVTLTGMGLGYGPLAILANRPGIRHLVILEHTPGIFIQALKAIDLAPMLTDPRVIIHLGSLQDTASFLAPAAQALALESIYNLEHKPSFAYNPKDYEELRQGIFEYVSSCNVEGNTASFLGIQFMRNRFRNLTGIPHNYLLESLAGSFSGIPAILVAAGPSLDKNIGLLPKAKDKALIISIDTALPTLLAHGVTPDFITAIDPKAINYEKIADIAMQSLASSLICTPWVTPEVPKIFPAERVFWAFSAHPIEKWLNTLLGGRLCIPGAGTVAHLNLLAAIILGCSPIILIGQDLAFTGDRDHASNTSLTDKDAINRLLQNQLELIQAESIDGGTVPTNRSFLAFKKTFEQIIATNPGHYINATEGGIKIYGAESLTLAEAISRYCTTENATRTHLNKPFQDITTPKTKELTSGLQTVLRKITTLKKTINKSDKFAAHAGNEISLLNKSNKPAIQSVTQLSPSLRRKLSDIDQTHVSIEKENHIWLLLENLTREGLRQNARLKHELTAFEGNPLRYSEWLTKTITRFTQINHARMGALNFFEKEIKQVLEFQRQEKNLQRSTIKSSCAWKHHLDFARLYMESGDMIIALPHLNTSLYLNPVNEEAHFHLGHIALWRNNFQEAEAHWEKAIKIDRTFEGKIQKIRMELGKLYFDHAILYKNYDMAVSRRMLLKGRRICLEHEQITAAIRELVEDNVRRMTEYFAQGAFDQAVEQLNLATSLDRNQAVHWETIGDTLAGAGAANWEDALVAYEQGFTLLPENIHLLKKISDCYLALGQVGAAQEALTQLKGKMEQLREGMTSDQQ